MATKKDAKLFTAREMEEAKAESFMDGMAACNELTYKASEEVKNSLDNAQAVFYLGDVMGKRSQIVEQLQLAQDAIAHLQDVFQDSYDIKLDSYKGVLRRYEYEELRESLGL
jgi:hypothetical protein